MIRMNPPGNNGKKNRGKGRPPKYEEWLTEEGLTKIQAWARDGLSEQQIAHNIGISAATLCTWKNDFPKLLNAIKKGKEVVDVEVENKLHKRAMGYEYIETKVTLNPNGDEKVERVTKQVIPDVTAQIFWLKNRKPDQWKDRKATELTGKDGGPIEVNSPREQIASRIASIASRTQQKEDTE